MTSKKNSSYMSENLALISVHKKTCGEAHGFLWNTQALTTHHSPLRRKIAIGLLFAIILTTQFSSAAHWIAGYVENASDNTSPDGRTVRLWNPITLDELFATVGPSGAAATPNVYMIDCELLTTPCQVGDFLNLTLVDDTPGYTPKNIVQVQVSGAGFDLAPNLTMNTPFAFTSLTVEDSLTSPQNEIDLTPANTTKINCTGVVEKPDEALNITSTESVFYSSSSSASAPDDNNDHYTNLTCQINNSYGTTSEAQISCSFEIEYYAEPGTWTCQINATDNVSSSAVGSDTTTINTLLALGVNSSIEFGTVNANSVSDEVEAQVVNYGNTPINLTLNGYGSTPDDGNSMSCAENNISIFYTKYNLTTSNQSTLTLQQFESIYENLTSSPVIKPFNLNSRQDDSTNDAINNTYWRIYLPTGVNDPCQGNIIFGAVQG